MLTAQAHKPPLDLRLQLLPCSSLATHSCSPPSLSCSYRARSYSTCSPARRVSRQPPVIRIAVSGILQCAVLLSQLDLLQSHRPIPCQPCVRHTHSYACY